MYTKEIKKFLHFGPRIKQFYSKELIIFGTLRGEN